MIRCSNPGKGSRCISSPKCPNRLWAPTSGFQGLVCRRQNCFGAWGLPLSVLLVLRLGTSGSVPPNTLYTFLAWTRGTFLFTVTFTWRARRVAESAFGNLPSRFRAFAKPVEVKLRATDVTKYFLCSHNWLQITSRHCLPTGTVDMEELTWQKFNLDHGAGNEVDGWPSANHTIQSDISTLTPSQGK